MEDIQGQNTTSPVSIALETNAAPAQPGLSTRIEQLEEKIKAFENKIAALANAEPALSLRIEAFETKIATIEAKMEHHGICGLI